MVVKPLPVQAMVKTAARFTRLKGVSRSMSTVFYALSAGIVLFSAIPVMAQSSNTDALQGAGNSDQDPNGFGDTGLDMFELIHRAQQGNIRNPYEFSNDQQENINTEAADFRTRQREALEQQPDVNQPTAPTVQPESY